MKRIHLFLIVSLIAAVASLETAVARPIGVWAKAVKTTLGPKGRNVRLGPVTTLPTKGGIAFPTETCYDYAFVSRRERNVDNIFFANTCTPELRQSTRSTSNRIAFTSLAASPTFAEVAAIEIDLTDGSRPRPYVSLWSSAGFRGYPFFEFRDRMLPSFPALGPYGWFAMVTTGADWRDAVVRRGDIARHSEEEPPVVLPDDPNDTRTLGRIAWIGALDASQPGYGKIVVTAKRGSYFERGLFGRDDVDRLYVLDPDSGEFAPLKDPSDLARQDVAMEGKEPATGKYGRKLAFIRNVAGLNRLWTCDLTLAPAAGEGGGYQCADVRMVDTDFHEPEISRGNFAWPCWSYDAKKIFFSFDGLEASTDGHPYEKIYMMNPDGTELRRLSDTNPDGNDNTDNDSYPACLPVMLQAATQQTYTPVPFREQYQAVPYKRTYDPAPFRCDDSHPCPETMTCGADQICR